MFGKDVTDLRHGTGFVIGQGLHHDSHTARPMSFVSHFLIADTFEFPGALLDRPVDRVIWHARRFGRRKSGTEPRISTEITATYTGGNGEVFDELGKQFPTARIFQRFLMLNCAPFRMAGHNHTLPAREVSSVLPHRFARVNEESRRSRGLEGG